MLTADRQHAESIANLPKADLDAAASNWTGQAVVRRDMTNNSLMIGTSAEVNFPLSSGIISHLSAALHPAHRHQ